MEYNFDIIPNEQTPKVEMIDCDDRTYIEKNREVLTAYLDYASTKQSAVGLAANQTSLNDERFAMRVFAIKAGTWKLIINPEITKYLGMIETKVEGCLTWNHKLVIAKRSRAVEVSYYDMDGNYHQNEIYGGFEGQIWQHEINHLNGVEEDIQDPPYQLPTPITIQCNDKCPCGSGKKYKHCCLLLL